MKFILWLSIFMLMASSCAKRTFEGEAKLKHLDRGVEDEPVFGSAKNKFYESLECPEGQEQYRLALTRPTEMELDQIMQSSQLAALGISGDLGPEVPGMEQNMAVGDLDAARINYKVRFDFCLDSEDNVYLQRIIARVADYYAFGAQNPSFNHLTVNTNSIHPAYDSAVFALDFSKFNHVFEPTQEYAAGYRLKGISIELDGNNRTFIVMNPYKLGSEPHEGYPAPEGKKTPLSIGFLEVVGGDVADPYAEFENPPEVQWHLATYNVEADGMSFFLQYAVTFRPGGYRSYRFSEHGKLKVTHTDVNGSVVSIDVTGDAVEETLDITPSHHNLSDIFTVNGADGEVIFNLHKGADENGNLEVKYPGGSLPDRNIPAIRTLEEL